MGRIVFQIEPDQHSGYIQLPTEQQKQHCAFGRKDDSCDADLGWMSDVRGRQSTGTALVACERATKGPALAPKPLVRTVVRFGAVYGVRSHNPCRAPPCACTHVEKQRKAPLDARSQQACMLLTPGSTYGRKSVRCSRFRPDLEEVRRHETRDERSKEKVIATVHVDSPYCTAIITLFPVSPGGGASHVPLANVSMRCLRTG
nr:hypothetical protein CFP56_04643 [Quercus suber]